MPKSSKKRLDSIQALRAVAAILVVHMHSISSSKLVFEKTFQSEFYYLKDWGSIGVDLFFVISGFIMSRVVDSYKGLGQWKLFVVKRAIRIIPLYWGLTCLAVLIKFIQQSDIEILEIGKAIYFFPFFEQKFFIFPIMNVGWTLSFEMYFYLIIGILLFAKTKDFLRTLILTLVLLTLVGAIYEYDNVLYRFFTSPLILEFGMGILCGLIYTNISKDYVRLSAFILFSIGLLLIINAIYWRYGNVKPFIILNNNNQALLRAINWGIPCALLLLGCVLLEKINAIRIHNLVKLIGDSSYSNYLIHMFVINAATKYAYKATSLSAALDSNFYIFSLVAICTFLSLGVYLCIEKPITDFIARVLFNSNYHRPKSVQV